MKLVNYRRKNSQSYRIAYLEDGYIYDLQENYRRYLVGQGEWDQVNQIDKLLPSSAEDFLALGERALDLAREVYNWLATHREAGLRFAREEVVLGPPQPRPGKILCVGRNYAEHAAEMKGDIPEHPVLFAKYANALIGPEDDIEKTPLTDKLDYEVELVVVIGKEAKKVSREEAYDYVLGYTIGNDVTARDLQKRTLQWLQGKSIDRTTPIGPWIVTRDDLPNPDGLRVTSHVNGELRQESSTDKFIFDIPYLIEFISHLMTLEPGDIILTGTPEGVAAGMEEPKFLQVGDQVSLKIDQIGCLENTVIEGS